MPAISQIADILTLTRNTVEQNKWDAVGLAQLLPDYESVRQFVTSRRRVEETSLTRERKLEIGAPSSYEHSFTNHPAETAAHKLARSITTPMVKVRTSLTFSEDEKELQGKPAEKLVDIVQMRMTKWKRDFWEGLEFDLLNSPSSDTQFPDQLRGIPYWVTNDSTIASATSPTLGMNAGDDPVGHPGGAGGITAAQESRWPNAVGRFQKVSQDDFFDLLSQFLNRVRTMAVVPNPSITPETPSRVIYVQEPVKRAVERYFSVANENLGTDGGTYRDANWFRSIPITIWHAMSDPASPVQDNVGTVRLIDWNTFELCVHPAFDQKITGPVMLPNVPGQMVMYNETWMCLECSRRDRNLLMTTGTAELQPSNS